MGSQMRDTNKEGLYATSLCAQGDPKVGQLGVSTLKSKGGRLLIGDRSNSLTVNVYYT